MTSLQIAQSKIKDLNIIISNIDAKYKDEYEKSQQIIIMLQKEVIHLTDDKEALINKIKFLQKENEAKDKEIEKLNDQLETLRNRIKKDSETSDVPSSANPFKKPMSTRVKSGKKPGGQLGHEGHTLRLFPNPEVLYIPPAGTCDCGGRVCIKDACKRKQLVDVRVELDVREECVGIGYCEKCGKKHEGTFSNEYVNLVNYGNDIRSIIALLNTRMNLPANKISELLDILTDAKIHISDGTVVNVVNDMAKKSALTVKNIEEHLIKCGLLLADETGCRVNGKLNWFQIFSNGSFTLFSHNKKRGSLLFEDEDLLALFTGIVLHDHFTSYYRYRHLTHAECNEHIDRRLKAVNEIFKHEWALQMRSFLFDADKQKKELMDKGEYFSDEQISNYYSRFIEILDAGDAEYQKAIKGKENITRYNEEKCLLKRLREYASEHLRFITNREVPRGNNGAERCAKEAKRKVRVSGGFRSDKGASNYARASSVISTMKKHDMDILQGIKDILNGKCLDFQSSQKDKNK